MRSYTLFIALLVCLLSCRKVVKDDFVPPSIDSVMVNTMVSGQIKYTLLSKPYVGEVQVRSKKYLYTNPYKGPQYAWSIIGKVYTDSNGYFSMAFNTDSLHCRYSILAPSTNMQEVFFNAGDTTMLPLTYIPKSVELKMRIIIRNNFQAPLFLLKTPGDTTSFWFASGSVSTVVYDSWPVRDSMLYLSAAYKRDGRFRIKTDSSRLLSEYDTATREFIVDPTTF